MEAAEARKRLLESQDSSTAQIHEAAWRREVLKIYDDAQPQTRAVYQFGHDTADPQEPDNWIIRTSRIDTERRGFVAIQFVIASSAVSPPRASEPGCVRSEGCRPLESRACSRAPRWHCSVFELEVVVAARDAKACWTTVTVLADINRYTDSFSQGGCSGTSSDIVTIETRTGRRTREGILHKARMKTKGLNGEHQILVSAQVEVVGVLEQEWEAMHRQASKTEVLTSLITNSAYR